MKKIFSLLLAAGMMLSLAACSEEPIKEEPVTTAVAETTAPTVSTEAAETEPVSAWPSKSVIDQQLAGIEPVVLGKPEEYEAILYELGYPEVDLDIQILMAEDRTFVDYQGNPSEDPVPTTTVHNITYNQQAIRMELSLYSRESGTTTEGWVLYCTKAEAAADLSGLDPEDYDGYQVFDFTEAFEEYRTGFVTPITYDYVHPHRWATVLAYYYPETGNLYNLVKTFDYFPQEIDAPGILCQSEETREFWGNLAQP